MSDVTRDDLREAIRDVRDVMGDGFQGIHDRLDVLNGRTRKLEDFSARHDERLKTVEGRKVEAVNALAGLSGDWKMLAGVGVLLGGAVAGMIQAAVKILSLAKGAAGQ